MLKKHLQHSPIAHGLCVRLPNITEEESVKSKDILDSVINHAAKVNIDEKAVKEMADHVFTARRVTRDRVVPYLDFIVNKLDTFDASDESSQQP